MFNRLMSLATAKNVRNSLIAALLFMIAMNLGATEFYRFTHGVGILDTGGGANQLDLHTSGYSPDSAYQIIAAYGSQGIRYHLMLSTADVFFPPTLTCFLLLAIMYFYMLYFILHPRTRWLIALPLIYLASDYLENVGIVTMLLSFPAKVPTMARLANFMFMAKNVSSNATILVIVLGVALSVMQRINWSLKKT